MNSFHFYGLVDLHDPQTALRERVWAVLAAAPDLATPVWRAASSR